MNRVNYIAFDSENYEDIDDMWYEIKDTEKMLLKNEYEVLLRYDDVGIYILEFDHDNPELGGAMAHWLTPEQFEATLDLDDKGE